MRYKSDGRSPDLTCLQSSPVNPFLQTRSCQILPIMHFSLTSIVLLASTTLASPLAARQAMVTVTQTVTSPQPTPWNDGAVTTYPIHNSCNATLRAQLERGLSEAVKLAQHAKEHLLFWGHDSPFVTKYFGNESTATPIGWYERVISADRAGMLFRCDDPDRNCATQDSTCPLLWKILYEGLTMCRLGRAPPRRKCYIRDSDMFSLFRDQTTTRSGLWTRLHSHQIAIEQLLGNRSSPPHSPCSQDQRECSGSLRRGLRDRHRADRDAFQLERC